MLFNTLNRLIAGEPMEKIEMSRKRKKKGQKGLSQYEEIYAKLLYGEGATQAHIAEVLNVSDSVISRLKKDDERWEEYRIPELSLNEILRLIKKHITRIVLKLIAGEYEDTEQAVNEMWRVSASMEKLYNLVEGSTLLGELEGLKSGIQSAMDDGKVEIAVYLQKLYDEKYELL